LRLLESVWTVDAVKLTFSTNPRVSPVLLAGRAKGRLDHARRTAGIPVSFSREVAVRSVGDNTRRNVEQYIAAARRDLLPPRDELAGAAGDRMCIAAILAGNLPLPSGRAGWGAAKALRLTP